jgi:tRNA(Arg) A34 adenosine deaminase TadA
MWTALDLARRNPVEKLPQMAAIIARKGQVISYGMNSRKSDPLAAKYGRHPDAIYPHAELAAIKAALTVIDVADLYECTLYVARVLKDGTPALAKPCSGCQRAILEFSIKDVIWTKGEDI